jgi:hypothetical protein
MSHPESIKFGDGVTSIGNITIGDSSVKTIEIGSGVTSIASQAFLRCNKCTSLTIHAVNPPTLASTDAFQAVGGVSTCPIYVPAESVNLYKTATNWSSLASRIQAIPE